MSIPRLWKYLAVGWSIAGLASGAAGDKAAGMFFIAASLYCASVYAVLRALGEPEDGR